MMLRKSIPLMGWMVLGCQNGIPANTETASDSAEQEQTDSPSIAGCVPSQTPTVLGSDTCVDEAACQWVGEQSYAYFGYSMDAGQDIDGDGLDDIVVGAPMQDYDTGEGIRADAGITTIWSASTIMTGPNQPLAIIPGANAGDYAGTAVAILGDVMIY